MSPMLNLKEVAHECSLVSTVETGKVIDVCQMRVRNTIFHVFSAAGLVGCCLQILINRNLRERFCSVPYYRDPNFSPDSKACFAFCGSFHLNPIMENQSNLP